MAENQLKFIYKFGPLDRVIANEGNVISNIKPPVLSALFKRGNIQRTAVGIFQRISLQKEDEKASCFSEIKRKGEEILGFPDSFPINLICLVYNQQNYDEYQIRSWMPEDKSQRIKLSPFSSPPYFETKLPLIEDAERADKYLQIAAKAGLEKDFLIEEAELFSRARRQYGLTFIESICEYTLTNAGIASLNAKNSGQKEELPPNHLELCRFFGIIAQYKR